MKKQNLLLLTVLASCTTQIRETSSPVPPQTIPTAPSSGYTQPNETKYSKTFELVIPSTPSAAMIEALSYFKEHSNSDDFYAYLKPRLKRLEGGNYTDGEKAVKDFRACLNTGRKISIVWKNYGIPPFYRSAVLGGWDGIRVYQNPKKLMNSIERAGHWFHEVTHACKFSHNGNDIERYPIIRSSFSYQSGYLFEDYLTETRRSQNKLAKGE